MAELLEEEDKRRMNKRSIKLNTFCFRRSFFFSFLFLLANHKRFSLWYSWFLFQCLKKIRRKRYCTYTEAAFNLQTVGNSGTSFIQTSLTVQSLCISFPAMLTMDHTFIRPTDTRQCTVPVQRGVLPGNPHKLKGVKAPDIFHEWC